MILDLLSISLIIFISSLNDHNLLLFVSSSLWMLAWFLFLNRKLMYNFWLLVVVFFFFLVYLSPGLLLRRRGIRGVIRSKVVCVLLSLFFHQVLILVLVDCFRSFLICFTHFLLHDLRKNTVPTRWHEESFSLNWSLRLFFRCVIYEFRNIWF